MISPGIFQLIDVKISEKWNRSSATYNPKTWNATTGAWRVVTQALGMLFARKLVEYV